ncbi:hypothetical protein ACTI_83940 [Actinoplanes sp. OR16]|uniref:hypothetical protein n=1 Tax=Actinoplanes sp. OR16 TaxID=946334 RepID=UPI000F6DC0E7|nr:hypothetical protein [Actinoplanes sp. OR16]BBH71709.1 hypothetical protein ACTI_83940 [Actinoplanes sp. OR16]
MIDFTKALTANPPRPDWTGEVALAVAESLVDGLPIRLDWDADAGEEWISLLGEAARVGIVSVSRPLAVLAASEPRVVERAADHRIGVVLVPSFADPVLVGDDDQLRAPFSADDLWFSTI